MAIARHRIHMICGCCGSRRHFTYRFTDAADVEITCGHCRTSTLLSHLFSRYGEPPLPPSERVHAICGICGNHEMFEHTIDPKGRDLDGEQVPGARICCRNCASLSNLDDVMDEEELTSAGGQ